jgi:hypothetical protein
MLLDDRHESPALININKQHHTRVIWWFIHVLWQVGVELTYLDVKSRKICITAVKGTMRRARLRFTKDLCL